MTQTAVDFADTDGVALPDFSVAMAAGARMFIMRAIYGRGYGGQRPVYKDQVWTLNKDRVKASGAVRSNYMLLCVPRKGLVTPEPEVQVDCLVDYAPLERPTAGGYCRDFPSFIDVEEKSDRLTADEYYSWALRACKRYKERTGSWPGIYDSNRVWVEYLHNHAADELANCCRWFAKPWPWNVRTAARTDGAIGHDPTVPPQFGDSNAWSLYQYQGDAIHMPGFRGAVDLSRGNVFQKGSRGDAVKWIQRCVGAVVDGDFGPKTEDAVKDYQTRYKLTPDGIVGLATQAPMSWQPFA